MNALAEATHDYATGNLDSTLKVELGSELESLFTSIDTMRNAIKRTIKHYGDMARTDPLTQLANRRSLEEYLSSIMGRPETQPIAFVMADIDEFKGVNDQFGHEAGDLVLQHLANILLLETRPDDIVCRWEFLLVLTSTTAENARIIAERIRHAVSSLITTPKPITISMGLAIHDDQETLREVIHRTDQALYIAKRNGRNQVQVYQ